MPSRNHYDGNPMDCIIFTVKRTLRERWRQIVTEGTRGLGFYLATIDESISTKQLGEMRDNRIHLVIPASIKNRIETYTTALNVITYEEFFRHHLDPAVTRWRANGII
ncbi:type-2 restriction enzyme EcoRII [bacterium BMS3Bbin08]|nr:type-2 restriction enzyme EcoRII [bacterium BMS3Bbin08]